MLTQEDITGIVDKARSEKWAFPQAYKALKRAGVESYEVDVTTHAIVYRAKGLTVQESVSETPCNISVNERLNVDKLRYSIRINEAQKTTYPEFLEGIASAGVATYRVDMSKNAVIYRGIEGEEHIVGVPLI